MPPSFQSYRPLTRILPPLRQISPQHLTQHTSSLSRTAPFTALPRRLLHPPYPSRPLFPKRARDAALGSLPLTESPLPVWQPPLPCVPTLSVRAKAHQTKALAHAPPPASSVPPRISLSPPPHAVRYITKRILHDDYIDASIRLGTPEQRRCCMPPAYPARLGA